jgi:phosphoglycerate kinase
MKPRCILNLPVTAFGNSHRVNSATTIDLPRVLGHGCCGYLLQREITTYANLLGSAAPHPIVAIVGGTKVSEKILLMERILRKIDCLIIGGALAYTFLKALGYQIGNSFHEASQSFGDKYCEMKNIDELATGLLSKAKVCGVEVLLPVDHVCHTSCDPTDAPIITTDANVPDGYMALDIGPQTIAMYQQCISQCQSAVWNGPLGVFEIPTFATGSFAIAKALGDGTQAGGLMSIVGGGASADAARLCGHASRVSHVSSGGGASLDLLKGKALPGIDSLDNKPIRK